MTEQELVDKVADKIAAHFGRMEAIRSDEHEARSIIALVRSVRAPGLGFGNGFSR